MAASIGMRPSLLKTLCLPRSYCLGCQRGQATLSGQATSGDSTDFPDVKKARKIPRGQIQIPKRKKRDSLAILQALSSTVKRDPTAPDYQFLDDPGLIPTRFLAKKNVLLSKASGRRTARFIMNEFKEAFEHDAAAPHVEAFQPKKLEYTFTDPCSEALLERIDLREVEDAVEVYNRMQEDGLEVTDEAKIRFLEVLCVFGGRNPGPKLMPEERLTDLETGGDETQSNQWSLSLAEDIFESLPQKTEEAYNWIVRALLKAGMSKGVLLYKEMKSSNIPVYLGTYNELIRYPGEQESGKIWNSIMNYLKEIKKDRLAPNLETFHCILHAINSSNKTPDFTSRIPRILAEMREVDIEPTLTTWSLVLTALGGSEAPYGTTIMSDLVDIINHLETQMEEDSLYNDSATENFLKNAMQICRRHRDSAAALKLFELKEAMGSKYVVTSLQDEIRFLEALLTTVSMVESPDVTMKLYNQLVPIRAVPHGSVFSAVLNCLDAFGQYQYVQQVWEDASINLGGRKVDALLLQKFLNIFSNETLTVEFKKQFANIAEQILNDRLSNDETPANLNDGILFRKLISIFLNNKNLDLAWNAMTKYYSKELGGYIEHYILAEVFEACVDERDVAKIKSFCQLPEHVLRKGNLIESVIDIIEKKRNILEAILDESELRMLQKTFNDL